MTQNLSYKIKGIEPVKKLELKNPFLILLIILIIGILLRIYISFFTGLPHVHRDSGDYLKQADALVNGSYINYFPNGYPLIIALEKLFFFNIENALVWTNILLSAITIWFTYAISKTVFKNEFLALATALLLAVLPTQINTVRWIISEVPTAFFLTGGYLLYLRKRYVWSGLFMGFVTLIRTEMLLIIVLLLICELIYLKKINVRFIFGAILPMLLLGYYCYNKTGQFSISGHSKVNIMYSITASGSNIDWEYIDKHPEIKTEGEAMKEYIRHMREEPALYTKERLANLWELWGIPSGADGTRSNISRLIMGIGNLFMLLFGIPCLWKNRRNFNVVILGFPLLVVTVVHMLMLATPRYTFPVEPFMLVLATWMLFYLFRSKVNQSAA